MSRRYLSLQNKDGLHATELAAAPEIYSLRIGKTPHIANPLNARIISAPDSSDTCFIRKDFFGIFPRQSRNREMVIC